MKTLDLTSTTLTSTTETSPTKSQPQNTLKSRGGDADSDEGSSKA